ncbi:hypothetical protein MMC15_008020 [Xylographa vitiligo]|nr:hypothetical protein [Xylographa vitiligo]
MSSKHEEITNETSVVNQDDSNWADLTRQDEADMAGQGKWQQFKTSETSGSGPL